MELQEYCAWARVFLSFSSLTTALSLPVFLDVELQYFSHCPWKQLLWSCIYLLVLVQYAAGSDCCTDLYRQSLRWTSTHF